MTFRAWVVLRFCEFSTKGRETTLHPHYTRLITSIHTFVENEMSISFFNTKQKNEVNRLTSSQVARQDPVASVQQLDVNVIGPIKK